MAGGARPAHVALSHGKPVPGPRHGAALNTRPWLTAVLALLAGAAACRKPPAAAGGGNADTASAGSTGGGGSTVTLSPRALALTGVQTEKAQVTTVPEAFVTTGEIEFDPSRVVAVNSPVSGRVRRLAVAAGDR